LQLGMDLETLSAHRVIRVLRITPEETHPLRTSVLWPNAPHDRTVHHPDDGKALHFGAFIDDPIDGHPAKCVAIISLFVENEQDTESSADSNAAWKIGNPGVRWRKLHFRRFATAPEFQRMGIGRQLLSYVFRFAEVELKAYSISTHAKASLQGLYEQFGMKPVGEPWKLFVDELVTMQREFNAE